MQTERILPMAVAGAGTLAAFLLAPPLAFAGDAERYRALAEEVEATLERHVLDVWFPASVDTEHGGFRSNLSREWRPLPDSGGKFSVFQGRMTWVAAQVALHDAERREEYLGYTRHGLAYLRDVMWDAEHGGFHWGLGDDGRPSAAYGENKHLYGMSFCVYGAAAAYAATREPTALELAQQAFRWIDERAHDDEYGGYHESLTPEGTPVAPEGLGARVWGPIPFPPGFKSMNTHIHLLESLTQLHAVWPDERVRSRLEELLGIVRDRVCVEPGVMHLFFNRDWTPVPDLDSYGHDVETAFLLLEASEALGRQQDPETERMARRLVDHALAFGWDEDLGGFYQEGPTWGEAHDRHKEWWVQMEGLNALLLMHERYGAETPRYFEAFEKQWAFIRDRQLDQEHGGVFRMVDPEGRPAGLDKSSIWKAAYHDGRALRHVAERLRRLAGGA